MKSGKTRNQSSDCIQATNNRCAWAPLRHSIGRRASMTQIAFIGLGHMGLPMARNLLKAGYPLKVFDLLRSVVDSLASEGAVAADSAADAIDQAQVVISMLLASRHVESLYLGDGSAANPGLLASLPAGTRVIDCSTIAPAS